MNKKKSYIHWFRYYILLLLILLQFTVPAVASSSTGSTSSISTNIVNEENTDNTNNNRISIKNDVLLPCSMEFLGAFLGVLFGLFASNFENRKKAKILKIDLEDELLLMLSELEDRVNDTHMVDYYKYRTPIWDISIRSGIFNELDSKNYEKYIEVYSYIEYAREIESDWWLVKSYGRNIDYIEKLQTERINCSKKIIELISKTIKREAKDEKYGTQTTYST